METYDSTKDTLEHSKLVYEYVKQLTVKMQTQAFSHDESKLVSPEKEAFDEYTPKLKDCEYNSTEYKNFLAKLKPVLDHHYANNSHHPEHFENGIQGFTLIELVEFFCDNLASTKRMKTGNIFKSLDINQKRFGYSDDIKNILKNTAKLLGEKEI